MAALRSMGQDVEFLDRLTLQNVSEFLEDQLASQPLAPSPHPQDQSQPQLEQLGQIKTASRQIILLVDELNVLADDAGRAGQVGFASDCVLALSAWMKSMAARCRLQSSAILCC